MAKGPRRSPRRGYPLTYPLRVRTSAWHECLEKRRDLYGEDYARYIAQVAFDQHLYGVAMKG